MPTGKYTRSEEHGKNISKALKGRKWSEEQKQKLRMPRPNMLGRHPSLETRIKLSKARMGNKNACKYGKIISTPEYKRQYSRKYYAKNIEKERLYHKQWSKFWRHKKGISKKYISELGFSYTKEAKKIYRQRRKAFVKGGGELSIKTIQMVYEDNIKQYGTLTCYLCLQTIPFGNDTLEHKIPLSRNGTNEYNNLGIACKSCNCKKHIKTETEYRKEISLPC